MLSKISEFKYVTLVELKSMLGVVQDLESARLEVWWLRERLDEVCKALRLSRGYPNLKVALASNCQEIEIKKKELDINGQAKMEKVSLQQKQFGCDLSVDRPTTQTELYDVDRFLTHRFLSSGEAEVRVRFVGFGSEEDEWINVKEAVRERSVALEHSECQRLKERREQARYYDAHILEIQRRLHDIRGCRCLFLIRYDHDNIEASIINL
ncbi:hypothetical protein RJ640_006376 [Escallonia rubra]|uniref:SAWADEE domain-containing protein n=1 Tax=Escallonia rubra TaxID=112253 RepID=A0AA88URN6_9ASTE|nr:hypothetical protein RJ640_006376 [Escallonia rubra]